MKWDVITNPVLYRVIYFSEARRVCHVVLSGSGARIPTSDYGPRRLAESLPQL